MNNIEVPLFKWVSPTTIEFQLLPGVGTGIPIDVSTRGGKRSAVNLGFSYEFPEVLSVEPPYALTGSFETSFTIRGTGFGTSMGDLESLSVGGQQCGSTEWVSTNKMYCNDVKSSEWLSRSASVTVGGQLSPANALFEGIGDPRIVTISPQLAEAN